MRTASKKSAKKKTTSTARKKKASPARKAKTMAKRASSKAKTVTKKAARLSRKAATETVGARPFPPSPVPESMRGNEAPSRKESLRNESSVIPQQVAAKNAKAMRKKNARNPIFQPAREAHLHARIPDRADG